MGLARMLTSSLSASLVGSPASRRSAASCLSVEWSAPRRTKADQEKHIFRKRISLDPLSCLTSWLIDRQGKKRRFCAKRVSPPTLAGTFEVSTRATPITGHKRLCDRRLHPPHRRRKHRNLSDAPAPFLSLTTMADVLRGCQSKTPRRLDLLLHMFRERVSFGPLSCLTSWADRSPGVPLFVPPSRLTEDVYAHG